MSTKIYETHLLIVEDDQGCKKFTLEENFYSLGRDQNCNIRVVSQFVSRRHATLVKVPEENNGYSYRIVDGDAQGKRSANGLIINGRKISVHDLKNEDEIIFGPNVRGIYYILANTQPYVTADSPEFDITLINPCMTEEKDT
ncbi:FHA domain-containing protein [Chrysosporum bergii ANA360D]|jgi:pSer/pThr/pTyr-binding forkhead associated (FHA) protein|uniref:FHA domain-containing protein n=1 Tax=Chrysosporum bergii ANA360D TaxID=617107 RepID=A0AA43KC59_9CYAN|nr:FHA domain-containing protein [Chrysosporum bergii]MDH6060705.1 FHA domain-containing protein [Chrysosporum bergii ANA360D]